MASDLRTRAVLAPSMLLAIGLVYWLDLHVIDYPNLDLGAAVKQGALSALVLGLLGIIGVVEYIGLLRAGGFAVARRPLLLAGVALHALAYPFAWHDLDRELYPLVGLTLLLLFPLSVRSLGRTSMQRGLEEQGATLLGFLFVSWQVYLGQGICFRHLPSLLYVVLICKGGDIGGYCLGRLFGRHKLIPHISPGKTIEGAAGSLLTSVLLAFLLRDALVGDLPMGPLTTVAVGIVLNVTTQTGDLVESLLKRRCGQKDSSRLLPAHGGVLDLIDSLLFSFSAWFLFLVWLT